MEKGDKVYAAGVDYNGKITVDEATVKSVSPKMIMIHHEGMRGQHFGYRCQFPVKAADGDGKLAPTRVEALVRLAGRLQSDIETAQEQIDEMSGQLADVTKMITAEK